MKTLLKLEELAIFLLAIYAFSSLNFAWWWFPALLLVPDLSMIGYVVNPAVGAVVYNIVHHKAVGLLIGFLGVVTGNQNLMLAGTILIAHSAMDRVFGYGLKYPDSFKHTSSGTIGG
jgi:hypothetical protein